MTQTGHFPGLSSIRFQTVGGKNLLAVIQVVHPMDFNMLPFAFASDSSPCAHRLLCRLTTSLLNKENEPTEREMSKNVCVISEQEAAEVPRSDKRVIST